MGFQRLLALAFRSLFAGGRPPVNFGDSLLRFIPKASGAIELGGGRVVSAPSQLRPLSLSKTDNKITALFLNEALRTTTARGCHPMQIGFIEGRQVGAAVLPLEASAIHGMRRSWSSGAIYIDFMAAFPSALRRWLW